MIGKKFGMIHASLISDLPTPATVCLSLNVTRYLMDNELTTLPEGLFDDLASIGDL